MAVPDGPRLPFADAAAFRAWVAANVDEQDGLWVMIAKKASGVPTVTYSEAVDVALCFGWIDGHKKPLDDTYYLQRFTPRRPRSNWSQTNVKRVAKLVEAGLMEPAGLAEVERAKADGRWDAAYAPASTAEVPPDLRAALDANPAAATHFATITAASRYAIFYRVTSVKKPETRTRAIERYVAMLAAGDEPHPRTQHT